MAAFVDSTIWCGFVKTINYDSLCNPEKLFLSFTIDTTGKVIDSEFLSTIYNRPNCLNKTYIDKLKVDFESKMPVLKPAIQNNKKVRIRYTIPVKFD